MKRINIYIALATLLMATACKPDKQGEATAGTTPNDVATRSDKLVNGVMDAPKAEQRLAGIDSLERVGAITPLRADYLRGGVYYELEKPRFEEYYYKRALEHKVTNNADRDTRFTAAAALSSVYMMKADYEGALRLGLSIIDEMKQTHQGSDIVMAKLYNSIGCAQLSLGREAEAEGSFDLAYDYGQRQAAADTSRGMQESVANDVCNIAIYYLNAHRYKEVPRWLNRVEALTDRYAKLPDADAAYVDDLRGRLFLYRAVVLQHGNCPQDAAQSYSKFQKTKFGKSLDGLYDATDYLMPARRYNEAADNFKLLDKMLDEWGIVLSLDNIQQYMFPKFRANAEAGRKDSAIVFGTRILEALDTAIMAQKRSDAAELATIYDTQQKEMEIARQQAQIAGKDYQLSKERNISLLAALILLSVFFVVYIIYRRITMKRLAKAHAQLEAAHTELQTAYNQLEETTTAKERIESELRIARDIQMSMVPHRFPQMEGLDLYAQMTPAREVGGDLYDYLLLGDNLYFCVGDVSGKGVPASLLMAQAIRLFRALAKQQMMPVNIATRLNDELSENNESGMFVTMFIGLVNLTTGHLNFCNCGHNAPVIGGDADGGHFLEMAPNAPIGLWAEACFVGEEIDSIANRPLFIYTDGLNEAENPMQQQFGDDQLLKCLRATRYKSSHQVINSLKNHVDLHRAGAEPNDDLTMMCLNLKL